MKYLEDYPYRDLQVRESIRQTKRAANNDYFDDEKLTVPERIVYFAILIGLVFWWIKLFLWALQ